MKLTFLGTGGGRHMMHTQVRRTGGLFFDLDDVKFIIDPGPGALVNARSLKIDQTKWDGILLSHFHVDNSSDANVLIDGMKGPFIVAEEHCILPREKFRKKLDYYPCITPYHQKMAKELHAMKHNDSADVKSMKIHAVKADHDDPTVGFVIKHPGLTLGYAADGCYYSGQEEFYENCDVLILNVLVPKGKEADVDVKKHMSVGDAIELLRKIKNKPKLVVIQHLSFWMLHANIWKQVKILQDATKIRTISAEDFMELDLRTLRTRVLKPGSVEEKAAGS